MKTKLIILISVLTINQSQVFSNDLADSIIHVSKVYKTIGATELHVSTNIYRK